MLSTVSWRRITRRSTTGEGSWGKEQALASIRSGERGWEEVHNSDEYDVRIYGDTAVVVGRWRARGANAGQPFDYAAHYVSVWVEH
jgi:ketosteroid isomerase-like protein